MTNISAFTNTLQQYATQTTTNTNTNENEIHNNHPHDITHNSDNESFNIDKVLSGISYKSQFSDAPLNTNNQFSIALFITYQFSNALYFNTTNPISNTPTFDTTFLFL